MMKSLDSPNESSSRSRTLTWYSKDVRSEDGTTQLADPLLGWLVAMVMTSSPSRSRSRLTRSLQTPDLNQRIDAALPVLQTSDGPGTEMVYVQAEATSPPVRATARTTAPTPRRRADELLMTTPNVLKSGRRQHSTTRRRARARARSASPETGTGTGTGTRSRLSVRISAPLTRSAPGSWPTGCPSPTRCRRSAGPACRPRPTRRGRPAA